MQVETVLAISCPRAVPQPILHVIYHLTTSPSSFYRQFKPLEEFVNTKIPSSDSGYILAYVAEPPKNSSDGLLILIHEFFGLNESICRKADALSNVLQCRVVAPDTFRGTSTNFIPKAIWLALSTPQERVNRDLNSVVEYYRDHDKLAVMGFCYGGGKAIRYAIQEQPNAATVVFYGNPVTDVKDLKKLNGPVCGVYGRDDVQFPIKLLENFQDALEEANVKNEVKIYDGVGHAFWKNMEQIEQGDEPQASAYRQCTKFLNDFFGP
jgi:carboxymethylenebutenolidase